MTQPIKYAGTKVDPTQSANEIAKLVQSYGGTRFEMRWADDGTLEGVRFAIRHARLGAIPIRLTARVEKVYEILQGARAYPSSYREKDRERAYRIAWRQMKDYVEQSLLAVKTGLLDLHEAFMAKVETEGPDGETTTLGELITKYGSVGERGLLLGPGLAEAEWELES